MNLRIVLPRFVITAASAQTTGPSPTTRPSNPTVLTSVPIRYTAGSLEEARALPPDAAKAILVAQTAGVDTHSPGETRRGGPSKVTFEVLRVEDGWFVYC